MRFILVAFTEDWYPNDQIELLKVVAAKCSSLKGAIVEIGCWEGKSTVALANACFPEPVIAVDSWLGNLTEGEQHSTVQILKKRDVYGTFLHNMQTLTQHNVRAMKMDCFEFLEDFNSTIKMCHVDASHDYESVSNTLRLLLPKLCTGGILCGDDFLSSHAGREDLQGGVERACRELLPGVENIGNFWVWMKE